jgi:hypothetical protein
VRQVQLNVWFRFRRAVEGTATILFLLGQESHAKTCASLVLRVTGEAGVWRETARETLRETLQEKGSQSGFAVPQSPARGAAGADDDARRKSPQENGMRKKNAVRENQAEKNIAQEKNVHAAGCLLEGAQSWAEVVRSRMRAEDGRARDSRVMSIDVREMHGKRMDGASFEVKTAWNYLAGDESVDED